MQCVFRLEERKDQLQALIHLLTLVQDQKIEMQVTIIRLAILL